MSVLPAPHEKARYVERMFSRIATGYDRVNRAMTFGLDQGWRRRVVTLAAPTPDAQMLDIGTGTGDFLVELTTRCPQGTAVGVDFTIPMMQAGWPKISGPAEAGRASFVGGDALQLPFPDQTFDVLTTGFVMRNVTDIGRAFREMYRVARPGARLVCLEVARPRNALIRFGHRMYFEQVVPWIGALLGGDRTAYTYLPQSARAFPGPEALAELMREAGWVEVTFELAGLGAVAIHSGRRPE
jgi:demethylmenaquinone methyltransferase/2-methoxy-6-polyprenyl-1,4-benzoquinol methylase